MSTKPRPTRKRAAPKAAQQKIPSAKIPELGSLNRLMSDNAAGNVASPSPQPYRMPLSAQGPIIAVNAGRSANQTEQSHIADTRQKFQKYRLAPTATGRRTTTSRTATRTTARTTEEVHKLLLESLPHAVVLLGDDNSIEFVNPAAEQFFGLSRTVPCVRKFPTSSPLDVRCSA